MWMFVNYMPSLLQLWIMGIVVPLVVRRQHPAQHQGSFSRPPRSPNPHPWERRSTLATKCKQSGGKCASTFVNDQTERPAGSSCLQPANVAGVFNAGKVLEEATTPDKHICYSWALVQFEMMHFIQTRNKTGGWSWLRERVSSFQPMFDPPDGADPQSFLQVDVIDSRRLCWAWLQWRTIHYTRL